jgi:hypothetical protein
MMLVGLGSFGFMFIYAPTPMAFQKNGRCF